MGYALKLQIFLAASLLCYILKVEGQILFAGKCPSVTLQPNFDVSRYTGVWYEAQKYPFIFELLGECVNATYTLNGSSIDVLNQQRNIVTKTLQTIKGTGTVVGNAQLSIRFGGVPFEGSYWVVETDYDNFSVVYSCTEVFNAYNAKIIWILTRDQFPNFTIIETAKQVLKNQDLSTNHLIEMKQKGC